MHTAVTPTDEAPAFTPLDRAIEVLGTQQALAEALGISSPSISEWKRRGQVPATRCRAIEAATGGKVSAHDLRPDLFRPPAAGPIRIDTPDAAARVLGVERAVAVEPVAPAPDPDPDAPGDSHVEPFMEPP